VLTLSGGIANHVLCVIRSLWRGLTLTVFMETSISPTPLVMVHPCGPGLEKAHTVVNIMRSRGWSTESL